jgi:predicted SnoaL-like aldol condensation-catalyzing enzyme
MSEKFNQEVTQFIKKVIRSQNIYDTLIRLELLEYLQKNPKVSGASEDLASYINQKFLRAFPNIRHLERVGILIRTNSQGEPLYALTQEENILRQMREIMSLYGNPETRPQFLEILLP